MKQDGEIDSTQDVPCTPRRPAAACGRLGAAGGGRDALRGSLTHPEKGDHETRLTPARDTPSSESTLAMQTIPRVLQHLVADNMKARQACYSAHAEFPDLRQGTQGFVARRLDFPCADQHVIYAPQPFARIGRLPCPDPSPLCRSAAEQPNVPPRRPGASSCCRGRRRCWLHRK